MHSPTSFFWWLKICMCWYSFSHNHGSGISPKMKGNSYWRDPFLISMIMGGSVKHTIVSKKHFFFFFFLKDSQEQFPNSTSTFCQFMSRTLKVKRCQVPCQKTRKVLLFLSGYFCSLPKHPRNMRSTWNSVWLELGLQMIKWQVFVSWSLFLLVGKHHWTDPWQVIQQKESKDLTRRLGKTLRSILFETRIIEWLVEFYQCVTFFFWLSRNGLGTF